MSAELLSRLKESRLALEQWTVLTTCQKEEADALYSKCVTISNNAGKITPTYLVHTIEQWATALNHIAALEKHLNTPGMSEREQRCNRRLHAVVCDYRRALEEVISTAEHEVHS
jgi:hypothetical protein